MTGIRGVTGWVGVVLNAPDARTLACFGVTDLGAAVYDAIGLRAELHVHQPQDDVRVMLDPAGHPFCLYVDPGD